MSDFNIWYLLIGIVAMSISSRITIWAVNDDEEGK